MKPRLVLTFCLFIMFVSCSKEPNRSSGTSGKPLVINPSISRADDNSFESMDRIGVTIHTSDDEIFTYNHQMVYNGESFKSESLKWYDAELTGDFAAYYPYDRQVPEEFEVRTNQASGRNYTESDLMIAIETGVAPSEDGITIKFDHVMSQLVLIIDNQTDNSISSIVIKNSIGTADVQVENKIVRALDGAQKVEIAPVLVDPQQNVYKAIIVPQYAELDITVTDSEGKSYNYALKPTSFESKIRYNARLEMKKPTDYTEVEVESNADINSWEQGGEIPIEDEQ